MVDLLPQRPRLGVVWIVGPIPVCGLSQLGPFSAFAFLHRLRGGQGTVFQACVDICLESRRLESVDVEKDKDSETRRAEDLS